jgi:hypothetical protein
MPSLEELRKNYRGDTRDITMYNAMNKASLALSELRYYRFPMFEDFFPDRRQGTIAIRQGSMASTIGFMTRVYFKNPGFKEGDLILIKVKDKKNPDIWGAVAIELTEE